MHGAARISEGKHATVDSNALGCSTDYKHGGREPQDLEVAKVNDSSAPEAASQPRGPRPFSVIGKRLGLSGG